MELPRKPKQKPRHGKSRHKRFCVSTLPRAPLPHTQLMLSRLAARVLLLYALHFLLLTASVSSQYIGEAETLRADRRDDRRDNRSPARSSRSRYRSSRGNRYRGRDRRRARRLLQAELQNTAPAWAPVGAPGPGDSEYFESWANWPWPSQDEDDENDENDEKCQTLLEIIDTHPSLTRLSTATRNLPVVRKALSAADESDTFFAPTNDAIESFTNWTGFAELEEALVELLGDEKWKGFLIAYHAVPDTALTVSELQALQGDQRYLEDALEAEMPLFVDNSDEEVTIVGLGSRAKLIGEEKIACNGVLHMVDHCLLPFDGDGVLDDTQRAQLADAKRALDLRYPEKPTVIDPDAYESEEEEKIEEEEDSDDSDSDDDSEDDDSDA